MAERRSLVEGLAHTPQFADAKLEKEFVFGGTKAPEKTEPQAVINPQRSPFSTRLRTDLATALKKASLERQLKGTNPNSVQDIVEDCIEQWLKSQGHL